MRISRDAMLMNMAQTVALRGTCPRKQVGAVAAFDGRVIAMGYNGVPSGFHHCDHPSDGPEGCLETVHAEANIVAFAAKDGIALQGSTVYTTLLPCANCARLLINAGVMRVVYLEPYRILDGLNIMEKGGISVLQYSDNWGSQT